VRLAPATRSDYAQCWDEIEPVLGKCQIASLRSTDIARYMRVERAAAPSRANHEKALLSNTPRSFKTLWQRLMMARSQKEF